MMSSNLRQIKPGAPEIDPQTFAKSSPDLPKSTLKPSPNQAPNSRNWPANLRQFKPRTPKIDPHTFPNSSPELPKSIPKPSPNLAWSSRHRTPNHSPNQASNFGNWACKVSRIKLLYELAKQSSQVREGWELTQQSQNQVYWKQCPTLLVSNPINKSLQTWSPQ